jgi:hypothetical protein
MKWGDFQGLLHHPKEQFDLPAPLIVGDFLRGRVQIVGENAQRLARLQRHDDLAHCALHGILVALGLAARQEADPIAHHARSRLDGQGSGRKERRVPIEPRDDAAVRLIERARQP